MTDGTTPDGPEPQAASQSPEPAGAESGRTGTEPAPIDARPALRDAEAPQLPGRTVTVPVAVPVTVALVLGLAIGLIAGWLLPRPGADGAAAGQPVTADQPATTDPAEGGEDLATEAPKVLSPTTPTGVAGGPDGTDQYAGLVIGTDGPLVELFEDYVCPFCARLELNSGSQLRQRALDGEYRLVLHPVAFLTEDSPRASNASACVYQHEDPDTWVAFHEGIYARQDPSESVGQFTEDILLALADEVGATSQATSACITGGQYDDWVVAITQQAFSRGVDSTPTLAVDGTQTDVAPLVQ